MTRSLTSDEQKERLKQAPERLYIDAHIITKSAHDLAVEWSQSTGDDGISVDDINRLARIIDNRATTMRDKCVELVRARRSEKQTEADEKRDPDNPHDYHGGYGLAVGAVDVCDDIIEDLESLTLE